MDSENEHFVIDFPFSNFRSKSSTLKQDILSPLPDIQAHPVNSTARKAKTWMRWESNGKFGMDMAVHRKENGVCKQKANQVFMEDNNLRLHCNSGKLPKYKSYLKKRRCGGSSVTNLPSLILERQWGGIQSLRMTNWSLGCCQVLYITSVPMMQEYAET